MKFSSIIISILIIIILSFSVSGAMFIQSENDLVINDFTEENIYAVGENVIIDTGATGEINIIGSNINVKSNIQNDFNVIGSEVIINGKLSEDLRSISTIFVLNNETFGDNIILGSDITIGNKSIINKDLIAMGSVVKINGIVMGDAKITASKIIINGEIYGNAKLNSQEVVFGDNGIIKGNVEIRDKVKIDTIKINGTISNIVDKYKDNYVLIKILRFFGIIFLAILIFFIFNKLLVNSEKIVFNNVLKSFLWGVLGYILIPILFIIFLITIIGIPIAIFLIAFYVIMILSAFIIVPYKLGNTIFDYFNKKTNTIISLIVGVIVFCIIVNLPYIGSLFYTFFMVVGAGAFLILIFSKNKKIEDKKPIKKLNKPKKSKKKKSKKRKK